MISEKDYVLKEFGKRFAGSEDLRFLVHGSREYAAAILDAYADRFGYRRTALETKMAWRCW